MPMLRRGAYLELGLLLGKFAAGRAMARRILPGIGLLVVGGMVLALLSAALLIAALYGFYVFLGVQGWEMSHIILAVGTAALAVILLLAFALHRLCSSYSAMLSGSGLPSAWKEVADAFMRGYNSPSD